MVIVGEFWGNNIVCIWIIENKFADNTKQGGVVDIPEGCPAIHKDFDRLEKQAPKNLFSKERCKDLHLGSNNSRHPYMLRGN